VTYAKEIIFFLCSTLPSHSLNMTESQECINWNLIEVNCLNAVIYLNMEEQTKSNLLKFIVFENNCM